jgi:hypothetical protein
LQRKCQTRSFLERGTSQLNILLGFLLPGSRAGPGRAGRPRTHLARGAGGHPGSPPPTHRETHLGYTRNPVGARNRTKPASAYSSETRDRRRAGRFRRLPKSFRSRVRDGARGARHSAAQDPRRLPRPGAARPGRPERTHLGEEVVHCSSALPSPPGGCGSRKSAQQVPGNHACHGATPGNSSPRGSSAAIA